LRDKESQHLRELYRPNIVTTMSVASQMGIIADEIDCLLGKSDRVADLTQFLARPGASFVNGETVTVRNRPLSDKAICERGQPTADRVSSGQQSSRLRNRRHGRQTIFRKTILFQLTGNRVRRMEHFVDQFRDNLIARIQEEHAVIPEVVVQSQADV
jgi:hypothetical protein